ncbi:hypothetical protein EW146_g1775 [Bondarzewia mesenterica]|uniref:Uncharacterized protein n=1 Tax=Bondarzewia mesenterica TaxID=1095465 RepID=A0A4S4M4Z9_9AGAM|nr:hypothetical protein EW146_g1775 [Bondarzewia mesenterica]
MFPASSNAHDSPTPSYNPSGSHEAIVDDDGHSEDEGDANFQLLYSGYEDEDEDAEHAAASSIRTRDMETDIGFDGGAEYVDGQEIQAELEAPSLTIDFGAAKKKAAVQADFVALPPPSQTQQATAPKLSSATQPPQSQQATTQQAAVQEDTATHIARARVPVVASGRRQTQHFDESDADDEASDSMELIVTPILDVTIVHTLPSPTQPLHPPAVGEPAVVYANANLPTGTQAHW